MVEALHDPVQAWRVELGEVYKAEDDSASTSRRVEDEHLIEAHDDDYWHHNYASEQWYQILTMWPELLTHNSFAVQVFSYVCLHVKRTAPTIRWRGMGGQRESPPISEAFEAIPYDCVPKY